MSKDKDKLIAILNELEKDYRAGNISEEKYAQLRERYVYNIKVIDASNRIRSMQGRQNYSSNSKSNRNSRYPPKGYDSKNNYNNRNSRRYNNPNYNNRGPNGRKPNRYDEFQQSNHYGSNYSNKEDVQNKSKSGTIAIGVLLTVILLFAFGSGIAMGIFNMGGGNHDNGLSELIGSGASINDTAFPVVKKNVTSTFNFTGSKYSSNSTSSYSSDSGSSSSSSYSGDSGSSGGSGSGSGSGSE